MEVIMDVIDSYLNPKKSDNSWILPTEEHQLSDEVEQVYHPSKSLYSYVKTEPRVENTIVLQVSETEKGSEGQWTS